MAGALSFHIVVSQAKEFLVDSRGESLKCAPVSFAPGAEECGYIVRIQSPGIAALCLRWSIISPIVPAKILLLTLAIPRGISAYLRWRDI